VARLPGAAIRGASDGAHRNMPAGFRRRIAAGFGLGGALATGIVVLLWNQTFVGDYTTAFLLDTAEPWKGQIPEPDLLQFETPSGASDLAPRHDDSATAQPQYEPRFLQEYFEPSYYAAASPGFVSPPAASTAAPWLGDLGDLHKIVPPVASTPAVDFFRADKLAVAIADSVIAPAPAPPVSRLANPGPFHLFVTSESVSPTASMESTPASSAFSAVPGGGIPSVSSVGETAGSLLRKR
jgi:hypothetical protein